MKHWGAKYIGSTSYNCWGLFAVIQEQQFGIAVPAIPLENLSQKKLTKTLTQHPELQNWYEVETAQEGDAVLLSSRKRIYPLHIGCWVEPVDNRGVIHCTEKSCTVFTPESRLLFTGWKIARIMRHKTKQKAGV